MSSHTWHPAKFAEYVKNFSDIDLAYVISVLAPISSLTPSWAQILQWRTELCVRRLPSRLEQVVLLLPSPLEPGQHGSQHQVQQVHFFADRAVEKEETGWQKPGDPASLVF